MPDNTISIVVEVEGTGDAVRDVGRMRSALDDLGRGGAQGLRQLQGQGREAARVLKDLQGAFSPRRLQQDMAGLADFFGRILSGARNARDVFKRIWGELSDFFQRTVAEMAAAWTLRLGRLFPLSPGLLPALAAGGPLAAAGIGGGAQAGALSAARSGPTLAATLGLPATTPFGDALARAFSHGLGPLSGAQTAAAGLALAGLIGNRSRAASALGGLGSGALLGFSVGGPVGAAIGAVAGGLIGLFTGGSGKEKEHDAAIANQGFAQLRQIKEDFERFRRDFASTVAAMNQVWNQMQASFVRSQSAPSQRPWFEIMLAQVRQIEDERNRRRQLLALQSLPEFQEGGFVGIGIRNSESRIPAFLHPGEFVMNREAVERIGRSTLEGFNQGTAPGTSSGGMTITVEPANQEWFLNALEKGIPVLLRKGGAASRMLRG